MLLTIFKKSCGDNNDIRQINIAGLHRDTFKRESLYKKIHLDHFEG